MSLLRFAGVALLVVCLALPSGAQFVNCTHGQQTCSSSNVGIGSTSAPARLTVFGSGGYGGASAAQFYLSNSVWGSAFVQHLGDTGLWQLADGSTGSTKIAVQPNTNGDINFYTGSGRTILNGTGFVGIGSPTPRAKLDTYVQTPASGSISTIAAFNGALSRISVNSGTVDDKTGFWANFYGGAAGDGVAGGMTIGRYGTAWGTYVGFHTHPDNANTLDEQPERMRIDGRGWVGIGVTNPEAQLHVNGSIKATSVIGTVYQDLAEWVPSTEDLLPGQVVVVDRGKDNHVLASSRAYDTAVAGVVSYQPGILLGEAGDRKETIATTGRVKVRVSAVNGPIAAGDLLVTSDKPGTAMKSEALDVGGMQLHRPGTLIGKALEALPNGEGEILVLLSLQ